MEHIEPTKSKTERRKFLVEPERLTALGLASPRPSQTVDYMAEKLRTSAFGIAYHPTYQRKMLELLKNDSPTPFGDKNAEHVYRLAVVCFEGYSKSFRNACIEYYLTQVLPPMEAEVRAEEARQKATDDLLDSLDDKSNDEIIALTEEIKRDDIIDFQ